MELLSSWPKATSPPVRRPAWLKAISPMFDMLQIMGAASRRTAFDLAGELFDSTGEPAWSFGSGAEAGQRSMNAACRYAPAQAMDAPARSFHYPPSPFNTRAGGPDEGCIRRWKLSPELSPDDQV